MAGSLIKIDEEIVTSAVASVTLTGIDSTYDVYMVAMNKVSPVDTGVNLYVRVTESGIANTTANYDKANKRLRSDTSFGNDFATNQNYINFQTALASLPYQENAILYLYNFNNASEYSFLTIESLAWYNSLNFLDGLQGGAVFTSASACDGIQFFMSSGNIDNGTFTLYGLKK